jgi:hypothetical protein
LSQILDDEDARLPVIQVRRVSNLQPTQQQQSIQQEQQPQPERPFAVQPAVQPTVVSSPAQSPSPSNNEQSIVVSTEQNSLLTVTTTRSSNDCVVCMDRAQNAVLLPCRHLCCCLSCAEQIRGTTKVCPMCRTSVTEVLQIFKS